MGQPSFERSYRKKYSWGETESKILLKYLNTHLTYYVRTVHYFVVFSVSCLTVVNLELLFCGGEAADPEAIITYLLHGAESYLRS